MLDGSFRSRRTFKIERMRIGQQEAVRTIEQGVVGGKSHVPIVLPTRYGKSDVMRMTAGELIALDRASCALAISPAVCLREQIVDPRKIKAMMDRYEPTWADRFRTFTITSVVGRPNANGEWFLSSNIQHILRNLDIYGAWIESEVRRTGKPVLVYIDEAHTGSTRNVWGNVAQVLANHGAVVILLTATPFRSKGDLIAGFLTETITEEEYSRIVTSGGSHPDLIKIEVYEGSKRLIRLIADYEYRLKDAWEEDPLPVAKIEWLPFAVNITEHFSGTETLLSELKPTEVRNILGRVVRDPIVVENGVRVAVAKLREFKAKDSSIALIVYSGNDRDDDPDFNAHARLIQSFIAIHGPELKVLVSTSKPEDEEDDNLRRFLNGEGDVLIVKQRGGAGLDMDRLKLALDLSPIRARAAWHQRIMRVATVFKNFYGIVIAPDEPIGSSYFDMIVRQEGGEAVVKDLELVRSYEVPRGDDPGKPKKFYQVEGTDAADFGDSDQNWAEKEQLAKVEAFFKTFPEAFGHISHAKVAEKIRNWPPEILITETAAPAFDTNTQVFTLRSSINFKMREIIIRDRLRRHLEPDDPENYGATSKQWWGKLYKRAGIRWQSLDKQTDLAVLAKLDSVAAGMLANIAAEMPDNG